MALLCQLSAFRNVFPQRQLSFYLLIGSLPFSCVFEEDGSRYVTRVIPI